MPSKGTVPLSVGRVPKERRRELAEVARAAVRAHLAGKPRLEGSGARPEGSGEPFVDPLDEDALPKEPTVPSGASAAPSAGVPGGASKKGGRKMGPGAFDGWEEFGSLLGLVPNDRLLRDRERVLRILTNYPQRPLKVEELPTTVATRLEDALAVLTKADRERLMTMNPRLALSFYTNLITGRRGKGTEPYTDRGGR